MTCVIPAQDILRMTPEHRSKQCGSFWVLLSIRPNRENMTLDEGTVNARIRRVQVATGPRSRRATRRDAEARSGVSATSETQPASTRSKTEAETRFPRPSRLAG